MSEDKIANCCESEPTMQPTKLYKVKVTLNKEKTWNEDIKKFVFIGPGKKGEQILVVDHINVEWGPQPDTWYFIDKLRDGLFDSLTYTVI